MQDRSGRGAATAAAAATAGERAEPRGGGTPGRDASLDQGAFHPSQEGQPGKAGEKASLYGKGTVARVFLLHKYFHFPPLINLSRSGNLDAP